MNLKKKMNFLLKVAASRPLFGASYEGLTRSDHLFVGYVLLCLSTRCIKRNE